MKDDVLDKYTELILLGHKDLFIIELGGLSFICKPLNYYQYNLCLQIEQALSACDSNEALIKMCVLYPESVEDWIENTTAANPDILADKIISESCFKAKEDMAELYEITRARVETDFMSLIQIYICTAFKSISPMEVEKMPLTQVMDLLVKAEEIINERINITQVLGLEQQQPGFPVPEGMQTTDMSELTRQLLDPANADDALKDAFGHGR